MVCNSRASRSASLIRATPVRSRARLHIATLAGPLLPGSRGYPVAEIRLPHRGAAANLRWRTAFQHLAVHHDCNDVGHREHRIHVVLDQKNRMSWRELLQ